MIEILLPVLFVVHPIITHLLATTPIMALNTRELGRTKPIKRNARDSEDVLADQLTKRVQEVSPGRKDPDYEIQYNEPEGFMEAFQNPNKFASISTMVDRDTRQELGNRIDINPNADSAYLAHEMGHIATRQTDLGRMVSNLRQNPKLGMAMATAMFGVPAVASAIEAGDEDLDSSVAIAALAGSPTLVDEGLATKNALAMMKSGDMRATLGQRGKLAGGLLSYFAVPIGIGITGNALGNVIDADPSPTELTP